MVVSRLSVLIHYLEVTGAGVHYTACGGTVAALPSVPRQLQRIPAGAPAHPTPGSDWGSVWAHSSDAGERWARRIRLRPPHSLSFRPLPASVVGYLMPCSFTYWLPTACILSLEDGKGHRVLPRGWMGLWTWAGRRPFQSAEDSQRMGRGTV